MPKNVTVHCANGSVTPPSLDVYRNNNDQVQWTSDSGCSFSVDFPNGSPFSASHFDNNHPNSGPVDPNAQGTYQYNVTVGNSQADPQIIVH